MKQIIFSLSLVSLVFLFSCQEDQASNQSQTSTEPTEQNTAAEPGQEDDANNEALQNEPTSTNASVEDRLKPIRTNFQAINESKNLKVSNKELGGSAAGGELQIFKQDGKLVKLVASYLGETGKKIREFYLKDGQLSFVFDQNYEYNRPIYYDEAMMKENGDNEMFDIKKSQIIEDRFYFEGGKMFYHIHRDKQKKGDITSEGLPEDEQQILADFDLMKKKAN